MSHNEGSIYILFFLELTIFISMTLAFYNLNASQFLQTSWSKEEEISTGLFYAQMQEDKLDDFVKHLDNYPEHINVARYYPAYGDALTYLQLAAILGKDKFIDELLKRKADPSLPTSLKGNTILHLSTIPHIIKRFVDIGLDLEALNNYKMTPLLEQVFKTSLSREVILTLLKAGANVEARTHRYGFTTLHVLFMPHHLKGDQEDLLMVLNDILDHGGRVDARDKEGVTPLHVAVSVSNVRGIQILVDKAEQMGIEDFVNIKDYESGNTPLSAAYAYQSKETATQLLKLGANPLLRNKTGLSVNGSTYLKSLLSSEFARFVLYKAQKYFRLPNSCTWSLMKDEKKARV